MRRRKTSKSAASAASANARAAVAGSTSDKSDTTRQQNNYGAGQRIRTLLSVFFTFLAVRWYMTSSNQGLPNPSNFTSPTDLSILTEIQNLTSSLTQSTDMLHSAFDDFYAANVQPLLDLGLRSFNGTKHDEEENLRVGYQLRQQGARAKYPVVMIPGFTTSGLELWEGRSCAKKHFRQRLWGSASMAKTFFADRQCWRKHLELNPQTGMDPENIRLRAAQGFEAADSFIATYWVWSKIIENLADVGYDGSTMTMMSYDWRLGYEYLEKRDGYFTKLKHTIEAHYVTSGEKVVIASHSMGGSAVYYFLQWVVADAKIGGGGGGKNWVEKYVHSFINISGTMLGVPKAIPALLSGELKDTAMLFSQLGELLEKYFGRRWRRNLWITWGSLFGMLPKGGDAIWGTGADLVTNDDPLPATDDNDINITALSTSTNSVLDKTSRDPVITWNNGTEEICPTTPPVENSTTLSDVPANEEGFTLSDLKIPPSRKWSMEETIAYLFEHGRASSKIFSPDSREGWKKRASSKDKRLHWSDPLATTLPRAPSLKIYCTFGVGLPTERSYFYKVSCDNLNGEATQTMCTDETDQKDDMQCNNNTADMTADEDEPLEAPFVMDTTANDEYRNITSGVRFSDGDATVPLVSLGYMCQKWAEPKNPHNPSGIQVFTRERKHEAQVLLSDPGRGGPSSGEHVDILGNDGVIEDVVRIATGFEVEEKVDEEIIVSDLKKIVQTIDAHELGGSNSVTR